jgi:hypothetical protein
LPDSSLAGQEHGRTIPLADIGSPVLLQSGGWLSLAALDRRRNTEKLQKVMGVTDAP